MAKRGPYKISHIRIIRDEPKVDYDELARLQTRYSIAEVEYRLEQMKKQREKLRRKLKNLQKNRSGDDEQV